MFCRWLSAQTGKKYRLPTEAEWEYACRAGSTCRRSSMTPAQADKVRPGTPATADRKTHPVAKKLPNAWKLYDMEGNVGEWGTDADGKFVLCGGHLQRQSGPTAAHHAPSLFPAWQATDPQLPKSRWWLSDGIFCGFRIVCEPATFKRGVNVIALSYKESSMTDTKNSQSTSASRREFLATTTAGGAALLATGNYAFAQGSDRLKVGLIGCGGRGTGAAANTLAGDPDVYLTAMGDVVQSQLDSSLKTLKAQEGLSARVDVKPEMQFIGLDAYLKVINSGVDVVLLTTPPGFRPQHIKAAVTAGKHIFAEKPMGTDAEGVRSALAAVKSRAVERQMFRLRLLLPLQSAAPRLLQTPT